MPTFKMLRSRSWWLVVTVLAILAIGYSAAYAQGESPSPDAAASPDPNATAVASAAPDAGGAAPAATGTGDAARGEALYVANCASCHGPNLEGGVGFRLLPLKTCPDPANIKKCPDLTEAFLSTQMKQGRAGTAMQPAAFPAIKTDQQRADLSAFIIKRNLDSAGGPVAATPQEKMTNNVWLITILVIVVLAITYGLAWYNQRWIAKKNA